MRRVTHEYVSILNLDVLVKSMLCVMSEPQILIGISVRVRNDVISYDLILRSKWKVRTALTCLYDTNPLFSTIYVECKFKDSYIDRWGVAKPLTLSGKGFRVASFVASTPTSDININHI